MNARGGRQVEGCCCGSGGVEKKEEDQTVLGAKHDSVPLGAI